MVVLQTMTGKMTGVKWWSFIFAPRFCDVSVLPCLVEIVNTKKRNIHVCCFVSLCVQYTRDVLYVTVALDSLCIPVDVK